MPKPLNIILTEATEAKTLDGLIAIWNMTVKDKENYSLVDLRLIRNCIAEKSLVVTGCDLEKGKLYHALMGMDF